MATTEGYTRANTSAGSAERKLVYAQEYRDRATRAQALDVSYPQERQLRRLFPLSSASEKELKRNGRAVGPAHTEYAIIRAQIAQVQAGKGEKIDARQKRAVRVLNEPTGKGDPVKRLETWYRKAWGNDFNPKEFKGAGKGTGMAGLSGYASDYEPEEMYDIGWYDDSEWDLWEFVQY